MASKTPAVIGASTLGQALARPRRSLAPLGSRRAGNLKGNLRKSAGYQPGQGSVERPRIRHVLAFPRARHQTKAVAISDAVDHAGVRAVERNLSFSRLNGARLV